MANFEITYDFVIPLLGLVARRFAGWCGSRRQSDASASGDLSLFGDWRLEAESLDFFNLLLGFRVVSVCWSVGSGRRIGTFAVAGLTSMGRQVEAL